MTADRSSFPSVASEGRPTAAHGRGSSGFVDRTLAGLSESIERDLVAEETASRPDFLQRLDPRTKVIGVAVLIMTTALLRHLPILLALYTAVLVIGLVARLPIALFVRRVWLALPFFTAAITIPAIFSFVTPGPPLLHLGWLGGTEIAITAPGVRTALTLLLRVAGSVSAVLLLVLTTRWPALLKSLRVLKVPRVFVLILAMTYRYIFLLAHVANSMFLARKSRTVGPIGDAFARRWLASTTSTLLGKSYHLSNEVYLAMLSRGFRGEMINLDTFQMRGRDRLVIVVITLMAIAFILADRFYVGPW